MKPIGILHERSRHPFFGGNFGGNSVDIAPFGTAVIIGLNSREVTTRSVFYQTCVTLPGGRFVGAPSDSRFKHPNNTAGGCPLLTNASTAEEARLGTSICPESIRMGMCGWVRLISRATASPFIWGMR